MHEFFSNLAKFLESNYSDSKPKLTLVEAGAAFLSFSARSKEYVLEYHDMVGIGLNNANDVGYGWSGYDHAFESEADARSFVLNLFVG